MFLWFWISLLTVLSRLYLLAAIYFENKTIQRTQAVWQMLKPHGGALASLGICPPPSPLQFYGRLFTYDYTNTPLEANPPPSHHLGSGRRPEKMHCPELLHTTYHRKLQNHKCAADPVRFGPIQIRSSRIDQTSLQADTSNYRYSRLNKQNIHILLNIDGNNISLSLFQIVLLTY